MPSTSAFWSALDAVVVINLDHRTDRWADMQTHLRLMAPMEKIHRLSAVRGVDLPGYGQGHWFKRTRRPTTWAGRAGCTLSHRNALRLMVSQGWQRMLILEDDARFTQPVDPVAGGALASFWQQPAYDKQPFACFLGFTQPRPPIQKSLALSETGSLYRMGGCLTTHAYVVNAPAAQLLLRLLPAQDRAIWPWLARHNAIDAWYARHLAKHCDTTAPSPAWVEQEESISDITQRAGGTGQSLAVLTEQKARPLSHLSEDAALWLKGILRHVRGF